MKSIMTSIAASSLLAALAMAQPPRYTVIDLGPSATVFSEATHMTNNGLAGGVATLPDFIQHAVLWQKGLITDIGTPGLGVPTSNSEAYGVNERGQAAGAAETSTLDPNGEDFCGYGTHLVCLPFLWQNGVMAPLPTLPGGNNGEAGEINNQGEVAGNVENNTLDTTCLGMGTPQVLQEKPVVWENGKVRELPTYPGDPDGWASGINEKGQVAGTSGVCSTLNPFTFVYVLSYHALLWDNKGTVTDLGNLGGTGLAGPGNLALTLNNQGQVIGTSNLNDTIFHAFIWPDPKTGKMQDLGTLPGDVNSGALNINDGGDVVGVSFDAGGEMRGFLWQNGVMTDLNTLIPADSPLYLLFAHGINTRKEIVGFGATSTGDLHAFLAVPCDRDHGFTNWCWNDGKGTGAESDKSSERSRVVLPENARKLLRQQLGPRYHIHLGGSQ